MKASVSPGDHKFDMIHLIMDDSDILPALENKDEAVFDEVFRLYSGACVGLARKILRNEARAQDVVQTVFIALFTNPSRFDPNRGSLRTFLLTQTHSRSIDLIRSEKARGAREEKQGIISLASQINSTDSVEEEIEKMHLSESMRDALNKLTKDEKDAIVLSYYKGYTYREVASILGQPEGTVKSRIRAAMSKLRSHLDDVVPEEVQS